MSTSDESFSLSIAAQPVDCYVPLDHGGRSGQHEGGGLCEHVCSGGYGDYSYSYACYAGDNGPATEAKLNKPSAVAADEFGNVLIADSGNTRIRKIGPDGAITTIAGNGSWGSEGDGGSAVEASVGWINDTATGPGSIYIANTDGRRVRKIDTA